MVNLHGEVFFFKAYKTATCFHIFFEMLAGHYQKTKKSFKKKKKVCKRYQNH